MTKSLNVKFENGIRFLVRHFPISDENSRKPVLFHDIRVGVYLYNHGYSEDVVLAGLLHDAIEWSGATKETVRDEFGENVLRLVLANTKDDTIEDKHGKTAELIRRCVQNGQDALIVKTADILDSFGWYAGQDNKGELGYCMRNANAIFKYKESGFDDPIFEELLTWKRRYEHLGE